MRSGPACQLACLPSAVPHFFLPPLRPVRSISMLVPEPEKKKQILGSVRGWPGYRLLVQTGLRFWLKAMMPSGRFSPLKRRRTSLSDDWRSMASMTLGVAKLSSTTCCISRYAPDPRHEHCQIDEGPTRRVHEPRAADLARADRVGRALQDRVGELERPRSETVVGHDLGDKAQTLALDGRHLAAGEDHAHSAVDAWAGRKHHKMSFTHERVGVKRLMTAYR